MEWEGLGQALLVGDSGCCSVELSKVNGELLVERLCLVLKDADGGGLPEDHRHIGVTAPVDSGMDAVAEADVAGEFVQLTVDGK